MIALLILFVIFAALIIWIRSLPPELCPMCDGEGRYIIEGQEVKCPACGGKGDR